MRVLKLNLMKGTHWEHMWLVERRIQDGKVKIALCDQ